jgi:hypothetical protein
MLVFCIGIPSLAPKKIQYGQCTNQDLQRLQANFNVGIIYHTKVSLPPRQTQMNVFEKGSAFPDYSVYCCIVFFEVKRTPTNSPLGFVQFKGMSTFSYFLL